MFFIACFWPIGKTSSWCCSRRRWGCQSGLVAELIKRFITLILFYNRVSNLLIYIQIKFQCFKFLMRDIGRERLVISMSAVCMLENAYQQTLQYVNDRETFGKPLIKNQEIRHVLADVKVLRNCVNHNLKIYSRPHMHLCVS